MKPLATAKTLGTSSLLSLFLLSACTTVGPNYEKAPVVEANESWSYPVKESKQTKAQLATWWEQFNDPTLNSLIQRSQLDSLDLQIALSRIEVAEAQYGIVSSQNLPTINAVGTVRRSQTPNSVAGLPNQSSTLEAIGSTLTWEADLFGRIRREIEAAEANVDAYVENYRGILVVLNAEIARTYIEVRALQKRLDLAQKNVSNQRETVSVVEARFAADLTSELDVNQAKQNLASSEANIPVLRAYLARAKNRLAVLLGQRPGSLNEELNDIQNIPTSSQALSLGIPRDIIRQRPDIRQAERQLAAQTALVGVAEADLYPRLSISGVFGFAQSGNNDLLRASSQFWSFGPSLTWNVFDGKRTRNRIKSENLRVDQARLQYEKTVLAAFEDVEAMLINYSEEQIRLKHLQSSVQSAKNTVFIAKSQYQSGLTNFQSVLDAERVLFAEEDRLTESEGNSMRYLVGIYRAMGGGWENTEETLADHKE